MVQSVAYQEVPSSEDGSCRNDDDMLDVTRLDRIRNVVIRDKVGVIPIQDKMR